MCNDDEQILKKKIAHPCCVDLESNCFSHGKLYKEFSKVGNSTNFTCVYQKIKILMRFNFKL